MASSSSSSDYTRQFLGCRGSQQRWKAAGEHDDLAVDFDSSLTSLTDLQEMPYTVSGSLMSVSDRILKEPVEDSHFQYILNAPTSPATKITEESLTYLNQGQLYELRLKQLGGTATWPRGKPVKSFCKVSFHERRLKFSEQENVEKWKSMRPNERIIDIDSPHSYGVSNLHIDPYCVNCVDFTWDPAKETSLYLRINCISTEFTIKKHGGEKGVSFRIQVDTYMHGENARLLHCASSQIKVFKPKGAERKLKTDRDKIDKLPESEKERYQPSYECTILTPMPFEQAMRLPAKGVEHLSQPFHASPYAERISPPLTMTPAACMEPSSPTSVSSTTMSPAVVAVAHAATQAAPPVVPTAGLVHAILPTTTTTAAAASIVASLRQGGQPALKASFEPSACSASPAITHTSSSFTVMQWLHDNRFGHCSRMFQNFTGADLLCLTRDELIQICGVADGIRLNNSLLQKQTRPRLSLFITGTARSPGEAALFQAIYLSRASLGELIEKLTCIFGVSPAIVSDVLLHTQVNARVIVTDDVVENMADGIQYSMEVIPSGQGDMYRILLTPMNS